MNKSDTADRIAGQTYPDGEISLPWEPDPEIEYIYSHCMSGLLGIDNHDHLVLTSPPRRYRVRVKTRSALPCR